MKTLGAALAVIALVCAVLFWRTVEGEETPRSGPASAALDVAVPAEKRMRHADAAAVPDASPALPGASFLGRVLDTDGRPVAGATVTATATRPTGEMSRTPAIRISATTAADGAFVASLPAGTATADVVASALGFAMASALRVAAGKPVEIRLTREGVLAGRVVGPDGTPVAGATLRLFRVLGDETIDESSFVTEAGGAYRFGGFAHSKAQGAPLRAALVVVSAPGYGTFHYAGPFPVPGAELRQDILLMPSRPLVVLVADAESGAPLAGASVNAGFAQGPLYVKSSRDAGHLLPHPAPYTDEKTSGADGTAVLDGVPTQLALGQRLHVRAWKQGFTAECVVVERRGDGEVDRVTVKLWPAVTVRGRVVAADGTPVARTTVHFAPGAATRPPRPFGDAEVEESTRTDADGRFVIRGVRATAAGTAALKLVVSSGIPLTPDGRALAMYNTIQKEIRPKAGEELVVPDIVLGMPVAPRAATIVVVDAAGAPVADAVIVAPVSSEYDARTDANGRALLHYPVRDKNGGKYPEASVDVFAPGFARATARFDPAFEELLEVRIVLEPGQRLTGHVRELDGRPAADAFVRATRFDRVAPFNVDTRTDALGAFAFDDLPAVLFAVEVTAGEGSGPNSRHARAEVVPGGNPVDLELPADTVKRGTLVVALTAKEDGSPLLQARAWVSSEPVADSPAGPRTVPGVMVIRDVPVGTWRVSGTDKGRLTAWTQVTVTDGETTRVELALVRGTPLALTVSAPEEVLKSMRQQIGRSALVLRRVEVAQGGSGAGGAEFIRAQSEGGEVRSDAVPPGQYRVSYQHTDGFRRNGSKLEVWVATNAVDVGAPETGTVNAKLELVPGGVLSVDIQDAEAPQPSRERFPAALGTIEVVGAGNARHQLAEWTARGQQQDLPLLPGEYVVRLRLPSGRTRETSATIRAGDVTSVVFEKE